MNAASSRTSQTDLVDQLHTEARRAMSFESALKHIDIAQSLKNVDLATKMVQLGDTKASWEAEAGGPSLATAVERVVAHIRGTSGLTRS